MPVDLISRALAAQDREFESDFATGNVVLQQILSEVPVEDVLDVCEQLLRSEDAMRRILGARIVREAARDLERRAGLVEAALEREGDDEALVWLASALRFVGAPRSLPVALRLAGHRNPRVRDQAAGAIAATGYREDLLVGDEVALVLRDLCLDPDPEVRTSAVFEVGELWLAGSRHPTLQRCLLDALDDADLDVRRIAREVHDEAPFVDG